MAGETAVETPQQDNTVQEPVKTDKEAIVEEEKAAEQATEEKKDEEKKEEEPTKKIRTGKTEEAHKPREGVGGGHGVPLPVHQVPPDPLHQPLLSQVGVLVKASWDQIPEY